MASGWWQRPYRGVYVIHSGPLPGPTLARAALIYAGSGATLSHGSAGFLHGFVRRAPTVVDVMVPRPRTVAPAPGVRIFRSDRVALDPGGPFRRALPRTAAAATVVDLAARARSEDAVIGLLTDAVRAGVSPEAIRRELISRPNATRRSLMLELLAEVRTGVESPLELRYRRDVERRHRLPTATLQVRGVVGGLSMRTDVRYDEAGVRVELDGELGHPGGPTARDLWRDNAVGIELRELTLRYRWLHVAGDPCGTAAQVARALRSRGWQGVPHPCGHLCAVADPDRGPLARRRTA